MRGIVLLGNAMRGVDGGSVLLAAFLQTQIPAKMNFKNQLITAKSAISRRSLHSPSLGGKRPAEPGTNETDL